MNIEEYEQYLTKEDKVSIKTLKTLDQSFVQELKNKVFDFHNITAKDIINIVYKDEVKFYISTSKICKAIGVELSSEVDTEGHKGTISLDKNKCTIKYDKDLESIERRFIRAHELGHLFKHFIVGIQASEPKKLFISKENRETIEEDELIAALSISESELSPEELEREKEATKFALELLFPEDLMNVILKKEQKKFSANSIQKFCRIAKDNLRSRLLDVNISVDYNENEYGINTAT